MVAKDAFGYSLNYFSGDYLSANTAMLNHTAGANPNLGASLYNGNIRSMVTAISKTDETPLAVHQTNYTYDQLNRLIDMQGYDPASSSTSGFSSNYTYDANGNILSAKRTVPGIGLVDDFHYKYEEAFNSGKNNRLSWVDDVSNLSTGADITNTMNAGNYEYDAIGQLTKDVDEEILSIEWTVTNKVKRIQKTDMEIIFQYNAMGNRIAKKVIVGNDTTSTYYTLDAQGNPMANYDFTTVAGSSQNKLYLSERNIYGSSRIGMETMHLDMSIAPIITSNYLTKANIGDTAEGSHEVNRYELTNHLGNVLNVVTDRKLPFSSNTVTVDYFTADVVSYSDYEPFGSLLEGRHGNSDSYRFGMNGMEKDNELKGNGNSYTTPFRQYDPRIGRWLSVDPIMHYDLSPFNGFDNNPILVKDPKGANGEITVSKNTESSSQGTLELKATIYLYNDDVETVTAENMLLMKSNIEKQVATIASGQRFNNTISENKSPMNLKLDAQVNVVIVNSEQEALMLSNGGANGNVIGVKSAGVSSVHSSGEGNGWRGTFTMESGKGNGQNYAHEYMHLFGLGDRYIYAANKSKPFDAGDISEKHILALAVPGDGNYYDKQNNLMVNAWGTNLSAGQVKFLYSHSGGTIKPSLSGYDFTHKYNGVLIGKITDHLLNHVITESMMNALNYYGSGFKSDKGNLVFDLLPQGTQDAINETLNGQ